MMSKIARSAILGAAIVVAAGVAGSVVIGREGPDLDLAVPVRQVAAGLVDLTGPEGELLLSESEARAAFLPLMANFETQKNQTYCGPTSIAMILNALQVPAPTANYDAYRIFTQENVLNALTDSIITARSVARRGMTLDKVADVLRVYGVSVDTHYADASGVDEFRRLAADNLSKPGRHVIVNFSRSALGQEGIGHISPLGAYDADSDRFLILDVARYKLPAFWVTTQELFNAMAEPKNSKGQTRGYLLVRGPSDLDRDAVSTAAPPE
jgi:Phytochelatin synthase